MIDCLYPFAKKWCEKGSIWLVSDTHFDDADCQLMDPDWIGPEEHVACIKKVCGKNDTLIHLGDVGNPEYLKSLKCYKVLIMGNHDESITKYEPYFDEIYKGPVMIAEKLMLSHESMTLGEMWFNIHGHLHGRKEYWEGYNGLNIASDVIHYVPVNLGKLIKDGILKNVNGLHRQTIDYATLRKSGKDY